MELCKGCSLSPELCVCPKIERRPCSDCGRLLVRSEYRIVDDERGFVKSIHCKDRARCAAAVAGRTS